MVAESLEFEGSGLGRNLMDTSAAPESGAPTKRGRMSRRLVAVIAVIVILIAAVGAGAYIVLTAPAARNVLVVGTTEREETLDPADAYNYMSVNFLQNTMATLLTYNQSGDGSLIPMLLTVVPTTQNGGISSDGLTYTLHLRSGATFEDGAPINASTVKYSIDRSVKALLDNAVTPPETRLSVPSFLLDPIRSAHAYLENFTNRVEDPANTTQQQVDQTWANYSTGQAQGVEVVDATTVKIHMGRPWSPMVLLLAFTSLAPVNPTVFKTDAFKPLASSISASGPYRIDTFVSGERAELVRNPRYFGAPAAMERVVIRFYSDSSALAIAMATGEIDVAYRNLNPEAYRAFSTNTANFKAQQGTSAVIRYLVFNNRTAPFNDKRVRQAFAYAVNRTSIVSTVFLDSVDPLYSLIPSGMFGHTDVFKTRYSRNIAAAQALLTQAGFSTTNKLRFTLWYTPVRYGSTEADVATLVKQALEQTGMVSVTLQSQEWLVYRQSFRLGQFSVFLLGWFPDYLDPDDYTYPFLHYASGGSASFGSWYQNDSVDTLINLQATQPIASTQRAQTLSQIQDALANDVPYLPLWQTSQQVVYKPSISGVILDQSQFFRYFTLRVS